MVCLAQKPCSFYCPWSPFLPPSLPFFLPNLSSEDLTKLPPRPGTVLGSGEQYHMQGPCSYPKLVED